MKKKFIGAMAAGLMVAGAAVAMNPAVASATNITSYESAIVDPTGLPRPLDSQFGNKFQVRVVADDVSDGKSCTLNLYANGDDSVRPVKSTFTLRPVDGLFYGAKTTSALKNGKYYALTTCSGGFNEGSVFTITNAPALEISGLATCYQSDQGKFIRPNGFELANGIAINVRLSPSTKTVGSAPKGTVSKFSVKVYTTRPFVATLFCGGKATNPARYFVFPDKITAPETDLTLIAD